MKIKLLATVVAVALSVFSYAAPDSVSITSEFIDYQLDDDKFAVVIVKQPGVSDKQVKSQAMKRAAEITLEHGFNFFVIDSENDVVVYQTKPDWPSHNDFPGNMYEEEIQEDNFNRDRTITEDESGTKSNHALQLVIKCYKTKPSQKSYNPCDYTDCKR